MKEIELTLKEYINFKQIFKASFQAYVLHGMIHVQANTDLLEKLGY